MYFSSYMVYLYLYVYVCGGGKGVGGGRRGGGVYVCVYTVKLCSFKFVQILKNKS